MTDTPFRSFQTSIREVAVLQEATEMILSSMDVDTVLHQILLIVRNYFGTANCAAFLVDSTHRELYCRAHNGYPDSLARSLRLKIGKDGLIGWVAENKAPLYAADVSKDPRYIPADPRVRSELALPLLVRDEVIGVLSIGSEQLDYFSDAMIGLLALFAGQAAVALENARLYSSERRRMRQIELINLIARSATAASDVEQLLSNLADLVEDTFDGSDVCLLLRKEKGELAVRAYAGARDVRQETFAASERSGAIAQAFASRTNVVVNDLSDRPQWPACFPGSGSELCVPLVSLGETLGALIVAHPSQQFFNPDDRSIAQAAADVCATAIRNVQLAEELRRITHVDSLTGLYNQRYFHVLAAQEASRCRRYGKEFSLLLIEMSGFREVGGTTDFDAGDDVLRAAADQLRKEFREGDSICRYGADRFVVILPETPPEKLAGINDKVRKCLAVIKVDRVALDVRPALASAVASFPRDGANELDVVKVLLDRLADGASGAASGAP